MKLLKFLSFALVFIFILFLISINGFTTSFLNKSVKGKIEERLGGCVINFSNIKISLNPNTFAINAKLNNPEFFFKKKKIEVKNISTQLDFVSIFQKEKKFKSSFLELGKTDIPTLISLAKDFNPSLHQQLSAKVLSGYLEGSASIDFEKKSNNRFKGNLSDLTVHVYENLPSASDIDAEFSYDNLGLNIKIKKGKMSDLSIKESDIVINHKDLNNIQINTDISINGNIDYLASLKEFKKISDEIFPGGLEKLKGDLNISLVLELKSNANFDISEIKSQSKIEVSNASFDFYLKKNNNSNKINLTQINFITQLKNNNFTTEGKFLASNKPIAFSLKNQLNSKDFKASFSGEIKENDWSNYIKSKAIQGTVGFKVDLNQVSNKSITNVSLDLEKSSVQLGIINYTKKPNIKANLDFQMTSKLKKNINIPNLKYSSKGADINISNLILDKDYKIYNFKSMKVNTKNNSFNANKNKKVITVKGDSLDLRHFVKSLVKTKNKKKALSVNFNTNVNAKIKNILVGDDKLSSAVFSGVIKNGAYESLNAFGSFSNTETASIQISRNKKNNLETTLISDRSRPFLSGLDFANSFSNGIINFSSEKLDKDQSTSIVVLNKFYVKKMPVLANLLSLTSFTGLIDTLKGKGVFFEKSYLEFVKKNNVLTIIDAYGTGDSLGYILEGKINDDGYVSFRGNLVPAYVLNRLVRGIPIIGKLFTGKEGDGVFAASFKLKGQPGSLKTTVNPIKTLTPRFIQRFIGLFKIKTKQR